MYEIIEKNQYGVLVDQLSNTSVLACTPCKYSKTKSLNEEPCLSCNCDGYYLSDSEAEKLESEQSIKKQFKEIESIFNSDDDTIENKKLTTDEFVIETRKILSKIDNEFQKANKWVLVTDEEYEKQDCDNCKGNCVIIRNGKELNCTPDKNEGECFVLDFQNEQFVNEIENIMFHNTAYLFYDLLSCELESEQIIVQDFFKVKSKKDQELLKEMQTMINNPDNSLTDAYTKKVESEMQVFYDYQKELIDLRVELRVEKEKSKALEAYSRVLELKIKELENKNNSRRYVCVGDEDNCPSYMEEKNGCEGCEFWQ